MDVVRALDAAGVEVLEIERRGASLDDVFLAVTGSRPTPTASDGDDERRPGGGRRMTAVLSHHPRRRRSRPSTSGRGAGFGAWWRDTLVFTGRQIAHIRQIPEKLLDVTLQPLMFVLLFSYVFSGAMTIGGDYREYLVGGILVQSLAFGLIGPATAMATDIGEGVVDRFRTLPTPRGAYLSGQFLAELAGMVLSIIVVLGTGLIVGWRAPRASARACWRSSCILMFASVMVWIGIFLGLKVRTPDAVMGVGFVVVFPLTFLSNAFVPVDSLPTALQTIAEWNPVSVLVAAVRELFGNPVPVDRRPVVAAAARRAAGVRDVRGHARRPSCRWRCGPTASARETDGRWASCPPTCSGSCASSGSGSIATVGPDGMPNLSPKGTTDVWDDDHLWFADICSPQTIGEHPAPARGSRSTSSTRSCARATASRARPRCTGRARRPSPRASPGCAPAARRSSHRVGGIVVIEVRQAAPLVSPAYDDGTLTEADVRAMHTARFARLQEEAGQLISPRWSGPSCRCTRGRPAHP